MAAKLQPHISVTRKGSLMLVTPYASDGWHKRRQASVIVDLSDRQGAKEELIAHLDKIRSEFQR